MAKQLTEEDLKKMSPEEIAALQKQNCVFCHIISGQVPSKKLYEDKEVIAILDIYPATQGHVLLLPKEHYAIMPQVPENVIKQMGMVAKAISHSLLRGLNAKSTNIFIANGAVAGQKAAHFMIHIIPRKENDGLNFDIPENKISEMQLVKVRGIILKKLAQLMKKTEKELVIDYDTESEMPQKVEQKKTIEEDIEEDEEKEEDEEIKKEKQVEEKPKKAPAKKESKKKKSDDDDEEKGGIGLDDIANLFS